jgi:hypothetical protein
MRWIALLPACIARIFMSLIRPVDQACARAQAFSAPLYALAQACARPVQVYVPEPDVSQRDSARADWELHGLVQADSAPVSLPADSVPHGLLRADSVPALPPADSVHQVALLLDARLQDVLPRDAQERRHSAQHDSPAQERGSLPWVPAARLQAGCVECGSPRGAHRDRRPRRESRQKFAAAHDSQRQTVRDSGWPQPEFEVALASGEHEVRAARPAQSAAAEPGYRPSRR